MAWTTPITAVVNAALTAAQFNASVRDNILETAPAKSTVSGRIFVTTGVNSVAERAIETFGVAANESTSSTSFTALATAGPQVTLTTGSRALTFVSAGLSSNTVGGFSYAAIAISGATTVAAAADRALQFRTSVANYGPRATYASMETGMTSGSNVFTMQYMSSTGTSAFSDRRIVVIGL